MIERIQYFPLAGYTPIPWRNGAGITREIVRAPAYAQDFAWRLSLATLKESGPFSSYAGYQRCVALVDGHGFRLNIAGVGTELLTVRGEHVLFQGGVEASCELLNEPCTDLSLIVRDPGKINTVTRLDIDAEQIVTILTGKIQVLFVLHGSIQCCAHDPCAAAKSRGERYALAVNDTLLIHGGGDAWSVSPASREITELLMISFSLPDLPTDVPAPSSARTRVVPNT